MKSLYIYTIIGEIHVCSASTKDSKGGEISSDHHYTGSKLL